MTSFPLITPVDIATIRHVQNLFDSDMLQNRRYVTQDNDGNVIEDLGMAAVLDLGHLVLDVKVVV